MSAKFKAVEEIKKLGVQFKGLIAFAEELEKVASLEQANQELKNEYEKNKAKHFQAEESLQKALSHIEESEVQAAKNVKESEDSALKIVQDAQALGASIIEDAKSKASEINQAAASHKAKLEQKLSELNNEIEIRSAALKEQDQKFSELESKLNAIREKLG